MHACMHTDRQTDIHTYIACIHTYMHAYMHTCIHAYMHTCIHAYMHTCIHAYMHTCIHTCMHAYISMLSICETWVWLGGYWNISLVNWKLATRRTELAVVVWPSWPVGMVHRHLPGDRGDWRQWLGQNRKGSLVGFTGRCRNTSCLFSRLIGWDVSHSPLGMHLAANNFSDSTRHHHLPHLPFLPELSGHFLEALMHPWRIRCNRTLFMAFRSSADCPGFVGRDSCAIGVFGIKACSPRCLTSGVAGFIGVILLHWTPRLSETS